MRGLQHFVKFDLAPILSVFLVCLFPCVFVYTQNVESAAFADTLGILGLYLALAAAIIAVAAIFFRNLSRAAFFADAAMLVIVNFTMLSNGLQKKLAWYSPIYLAAIFVILLLALLVLLLRKKPDMRIACTLVAIAFVSVTVMNLILAIPAIYRSHQTVTPDAEQAVVLSAASAAQSAEELQTVTEETADAETEKTPVAAAEAEVEVEVEASVTETPASDAEPEAAEEAVLPEEAAEPVAENIFTDEERPNVYYFIFDEYGGYENLLHYFDYDNSAFLYELEAKGFNISWESRNTEAVYTNTLVPNLMNLNYVMEAGEYENRDLTDYYMDNSYLVRTFLENGYQVNLADHLDFIGHTGCNVLTENQTEKTISDILVGNSIFSKFDKSEANYYDQVMNVMEAERNCWQYTQDTPTLTIGYLQVPHSPLAFNREGEANERKDYYNWRRDELYLDQLEYISDYILELMDIVLEHDPDALIILQSDHGCRYPIHQIQVGLADVCDPYTEYPHMQNILNCVYYRGETIEIEGLTGINTLRRAFNQVLGTGFEELEPVYNWDDLSEEITQFE